MSKLTITPMGGTGFSARIDELHLGCFSFGSLDEEGQYEQDEDEIIEEARRLYLIDESVPALVC